MIYIGNGRLTTLSRSYRMLTVTALSTYMLGTMRDYYLTPKDCFLMARKMSFDVMMMVAVSALNRPKRFAGFS
jgi:hypothetical protein